MTKQSCQDYSYEIDDSSFSGYWAKTTIQVSQDQVMGRSLVAGNVSDTDGSRFTTTTWTETASEIGSHPEGRPARTMEQLYADCDRDVLTQDPDQNQVSFQADAQGVLRSCWYVPRNCADDCTFGVVLSQFSCGLAP